jgi:hypothetical protein
MDDTQRLKNHISALEKELDLLWQLFGMRSPKRIDSGGSGVARTRDANNGHVIDRGAA